MADEERGGGLMLMGPPPSSDASVVPGAETAEGSGEIDLDREAYVAAAREVLSAIETKDVNALAAALRAAASIGKLSDMDLGDGEA